MKLGNVQFEQVKELMGFDLNENDKIIWNKYHNQNADLEGKKESFHVFLMPLCIVVKGDKAIEAIKKIFDNKKLVEPKGEIQVYFKK